MLKQSITWEGFDGRTKNKTLYFNLTRFEIAHDMELEVLEQRFKDFQENVIGENPDETRQMSPPEIREMLDIVKVLIKHSYGERSADGQEFSKNDEVWRKFNDTGAFDAFVWYLFEDPNRANAFMTGIWPKELQEAAAKVREERPDIRPVEDVDMPGNVGQEAPVAPDDNIPSIESPHTLRAVMDEEAAPKQWHEYSEQDLLNMNSNEFETLYAEASRGKNVPPQLLVLRQRRKKLDTPGGATE